MKKILSTIFIGLLCLSMFPMFAPHVKAESAYLTDIVRLTPNPYDDRGAGWSPDSSKIAYGAFVDSWYRHIWVMNRDGSGKMQLTFGDVVDEGPDYSPDGSKIVFTRYGLRGWGIHDIFIMNADGSGVPERITSTGLARLNVKWSNDGQRLAFYYGGAGTPTWEIHIMNADGTNEVTVVSSTSSELAMNAYWSPDDTRLVYSMDDGIWVVDASPPYQKTRVFQTSLPTMYAVYSPDGNYIMYASGMYGQLQDLYLIDVSGNFIAQLTYDTKFGYGFDWSPDGEYIAFNSISSGNYDVWRARIVIEGAGARSPVGYWKFDDGSGATALDGSGNGNTGTLTSSPQWVNGIAGTALEFDGVDDVVMVPDSASLVVARAQNQLTLETWIKPTVTLDSSTTPMFLILKGNEYGFELNNAGDAYTPPTMDGKIRFCMCLVNQSTNYLQPEEIRTNTNVWTAGIWHHLAATYDGNSLEIYVNGILENSRQLTGILWPTSYGGELYPLSIAAYTIGPHYTGGNLEYFKGILDEIRVYNYAKTADEIWNDYVSVSPPQQPDFDLSVSPRSQIGQPSSSVYYQIAITSKNGFSSSVNLGVAFSPDPLNYGYHILPTSTVTPPPDGQAVRTLEFEIYPNTPLKTFTITVTANSGPITKTGTTALNVERSLEVPYQNQGYANWCGPTSLAMVIRYYGEEFHSWNYTSDENLRTDTGISDLNDLGAYVKQHYPLLSVESRSYGILNKGLIFADAKTDLSNGYPILLALGKPPTPIISQGGHVVVIAGVNESGIFVSDPSGYLFSDLAVTTPLPWPYIHAYIDWSKIEPFIVTWPYTSTLTVKGIPGPEDEFGTMFITTHGDVCFFQPDDPQLSKDYYDLSLNQGLKWNHTGKSELDPVIDRKCSSLYAHVSISNCRPIQESFTAFCKILCPNNVIHPMQAKEINAVPAFGQTGVYWRLDNLDSLLPKGGPYYLEFELSDSNGVQVDHFVTEPFYWRSQSVKLKEKQHNLYLHVYDEQGNHVGLSYVSGQVEFGIPGSYYSDDGNGTITIVVPQIIDLRIVIDAQYAEEPIEIYDLSVILSTDSGVFEQIHSGNITAGEKQTLTTKASETGLSLYFWQYIFKDSKRGTELRINALDKYFQFIAPGKDFGVKNDPKMIFCRNTIVICYNDKEICMAAIATTGKTIACTATLLDKQTHKLYVLISCPSCR